MNIKPAYTVVLLLNFLLTFGQVENEMEFTVKRQPAYAAKTYLYQKISRYMLDTAYSNIVTIKGDSFALYSYLQKRAANGNPEGEMNKAILFSGCYRPQNDSAYINYNRPGTSEKTAIPFIKVKDQPHLVNFSWPDFFNGIDQSKNQSAIYSDKKKAIKIDSITYSCIDVVYLRDTIVRNQLPIKIKGKRWNAAGSHTEVITTHVYLRSEDYLPIKIVELRPTRQALTYDYQTWAINNMWIVKQRAE